MGTAIGLFAQIEQHVSIGVGNARFKELLGNDPNKNASHHEHSYCGELQARRGGQRDSGGGRAAEDQTGNQSQREHSAIRVQPDFGHLILETNSRGGIGNDNYLSLSSHHDP